MLLPSLNESHLVDLFERGQALANFGQGGVSQKRHPFIPRDTLDLRRRPAADDHLADMVGQVQQLGDGATSAEARAGALQKSDALLQFDLAPDRPVKT